MLPFRTSWLFRSRWIALVWAAGICWAAVKFVGPSKDDRDTQTASASPQQRDATEEQLKQVEQALRKLNQK